MVSLRIVNVDYYLCSPIRGIDIMYSHFRGSPVKQVPVIRVFGITDQGVKACIHVHGVLPYMYVPFDGKEAVDREMYEIANGIDSAINARIGNSNKHHVFKILLVNGIPFYGYHSREYQFFKIYFYNPSSIQKVVEILENGEVCNKKIQPFEAHIPFILQFFIDYNLYGMSFMHLTEWIQRDLVYNDDYQNLSQIDFKATYCELEGDAQAESIKNKTDISANRNPGLANIWAEELERRKFDGKSLNFSLPESQERLLLGHNELEHKLMEQLFVSLKKKLIPKTDQCKLKPKYIDEISKHSDIPAASHQLFYNCEDNGVEVFESSDNSIFLNSMDISLVNAIQMIMAENDEADFGLIENDSILGTQKESDNSDEDIENVDLSQPLDVEIPPRDSECEVEICEYLRSLKTRDDKNKSSGDGKKDKKPYSDVNFFLENNDKKSESEIQKSALNPLFVDGSSDEFASEIKRTPKKKRKKPGPDSPMKRYRPLQISIQKSPNKITLKEEGKESKTKNSTEEDIDVALLKQLECSAAQITEQIRSPHSSPTNQHNIQRNKICVGRVEQLKKQLKIEPKTGKREENRYKSYNCLKIQLSKLSKTRDESEIVSDESVTAEIIEQGIDNLKNRHLFSENSIQIGNEIKKSLLPYFNPQKSSNLLDNSIEPLNISNEPQSEFNNTLDKEIPSSSHTPDNAGDLNFTGVISFYSPVNYNLTPETKYPGKNYIKNCFEPLNLPPSYDDVLNNLKKHGLSKCLRNEPFYGNPGDGLSKKEVCFELIKITPRSLSCLEEYKGTFSNFLNEARSNHHLKHFLFDWKKEGFSSVLTTKKQCILTPVFDAPNPKHAEIWMSNTKSTPKKVSKIEKRMQIFIQNSPDMSDTQSMVLTPYSPVDILESSIHSISSAQNYHFPLTSYTKDIANKPQTLVNDILSTERMDENVSTNANYSKVCNMSGTKHLQPELDRRSNSCALECATPENSGVFKMDFQNLQEAHAVSEYKYITLFEMEIHVPTRGDLRPDPEYDPISTIFYSILNDVPTESKIPRQMTGIIICTEGKNNWKFGIDYSILEVQSEIDLIYELINLIRDTDPDILTGYEIEMLSWGYVVERGYKLEINVIEELNRLRRTFTTNFSHDSPFRGNELKIIGRIVLNVWKLMRHEAALMSYSFENVIYHILHTRIPNFTFQRLSMWWASGSKFFWELTLKYYIVRVLGVIQLLEQLDLIGRTSELASLFGIQFYEVFSRGSQFRVESMMLRMAKPLNYIAISPSIRQRAAMRAPECLPLIMEPKSRFYSDPVIVLDFQSLYPSMIIAYNYCFSTCLGRVDLLAKQERFEFGCSELEVSIKELMTLKNNIHISPTGIAYVKSNVRAGVLPQMLEEILNTRLMVKQSLKAHKNNTLIKKVLDARQLGLKLIANVTYGYTSANFSGRMACVEVADSVVSKGRETLEKAIKLVSKTEKWGAEVVYGDTDSMFVLVPGKSREEAFRIGQEIADAVTKSNPKPVKLKLEKIYQPCILQTKKRYVGYMYECIEQQHPVYDAKGIETVRRDGCPAVSKVLEKSLKIIFETYDVSQVKDYVSRQMVKLISGRLSIQELTFAREYRGLSGYKPGACVPALKLARESLLKDRRSEPRPGERVGYVIACGPPGSPLISSVYSPKEILKNRSLHINYDYYITKVILPPLDRCFALLGVDVHSWYNLLPRKQHIYLQDTVEGSKKGTISQYFASMNCLTCNTLCSTSVCESCKLSPQMLAVKLTNRINKWERKHFFVAKLCFSCCGGMNGTDCSSLDCPILYQKMLADNDFGQVKFVRQLLYQNIPQ